MTKKYTLLIALLTGALLACSCATGRRSEKSEIADALVGAWRGKVQFTSGAFAATTDLEFMYVFNVGGTMTESSNYDASPPVPPAYGVWKKVGSRQYEARYEYYWTKAPSNFVEISKGGGWSPGGRGVLSQRITISEDGDSFDSTVKYDVFDQQGKPTEAASEATGKGIRLKF
jgi:hypothetical protein